MYALFLALSLFIVAAVPFRSYAQTFNRNVSDLVGFDGEPSIAVNPVNQNNVVAGWMRLRLDGRIWIAVRTSFDGGATWTPMQFLPHAAQDYGSADVSIAFHRTGIAYLSYVDFRMSPDTVGGVYLVHSTDGGLSWSSPREVVSTNDRPDLPIDRPWIAVDNSGGTYDGTVYVSSMSAYWFPGEHHMYVRSTQDRGVTWSTLYQVDDSAFSPGLMTKAYGAISVGADGRVYTAFMSYDTKASPLIRILSATTTDAGATWRRSLLTNVSLSKSITGYTAGYCVAADPSRAGHAVLAWIDERYGDIDVLLKHTTDGGATWSLPVRINDDPTGNGVGQDLVWAQFAPAGLLAIVWRDRRMNGAGLTVPSDIYGTISRDGGYSFPENQRLSTASSPYMALGCCNSFLGVALTDSSIITDWSDYRSNDWEVYVHTASMTVSVNESTASKLPGGMLEHNYPNPFSESTVIAYSLPSLENITLKIYDTLGRHIETLVEGWQDAGSHQVTFTLPAAAAGNVYFVRLTAGALTKTSSMTLLRFLQ
ncbi:MAG: exo-alpha-sialidase [Bacteroidota bacterium]